MCQVKRPLSRAIVAVQQHRHPELPNGRCCVPFWPQGKVNHLDADEVFQSSQKRDRRMITQFKSVSTALGELHHFATAQFPMGDGKLRQDNAESLPRPLLEVSIPSAELDEVSLGFFRTRRCRLMPPQDLLRGEFDLPVEEADRDMIELRQPHELCRARLRFSFSNSEREEVPIPVFSVTWASVRPTFWRAARSFSAMLMTSSFLASRIYRRLLIGQGQANSQDFFCNREIWPSVGSCAWRQWGLKGVPHGSTAPARTTEPTPPP